METTLTFLLLTAVSAGFIHTLAGPDHYLPFIAIGKSRQYGLVKTLLWTILCGIGHVGSALLLGLLFVFAAHLLSESQFEWIEAWRGDIAAWALVGAGMAILLYALRCRLKKQPHAHAHCHADGSTHSHTHTHDAQHGHLHESPAGVSTQRKLSYWVVFIIFVLGPCEALLPLLMAAAVMDTASVVAVCVTFSVATIVTMLAAVAAGYYGIKLLRLNWLGRYATEAAGLTLTFCGLGILFLGL